MSAGSAEASARSPRDSGSLVAVNAVTVDGACRDGGEIERAQAGDAAIEVEVELPGEHHHRLVRVLVAVEWNLRAATGRPDSGVEQAAGVFGARDARDKVARDNAAGAVAGFQVIRSRFTR